MPSPVDSIWQQYNWRRDRSFPLPVSCLQVFLSDLMTVKKLIEKEVAGGQPAPLLVVDIGHTIEKVTDAIDVMTEGFINYDDFSQLLFHN
jgi:hypothetical protein